MEPAVVDVGSTSQSPGPDIEEIDWVATFIVAVDELSRVLLAL